MLSQTWYHGTLRKYVIVFGTLFNNIYINRTNLSGETIQTMKVPLNYGPKDKTLVRLKADADLRRPVAITLPRMSFEISNLVYDPERKLNTIQKLFNLDPNSNRVLYQYMSVPYNINFQLSIMVKNADDGTRIVEQILPYFTPEWTSTVNIIPELNKSIDIPVILNGVSYSDTYEGNFEDRRAIIWTLDFTMKAYLFGPTRKSGSENNSGLITKAITNFYVPAGEIRNSIGLIDPDESVIITPGLDENGNPTTDPNLTIDRNEIKPSDDWDYIIQFMSDE